MLYLALFKEYLSKMVPANPSIDKEVRDAIIDGVTIPKSLLLLVTSKSYKF